MKTRLLVISDLHLGGSPQEGDEPAFQICTALGRGRLVSFLDWATKHERSEWNTHLVIAGDVVDFLAEKTAGGFQSFTANDAVATDKLLSIIQHSQEVWDALQKFVAAGHSLTLLLGNHDLELSLPGPRRRLVDALGPGKVEFLYDNQAFTLGRVLVEHGNRYDDWNAVPHDDLREVRSRLSRGEPADFDPLPGSRMVTDLVNPIKAKLSFVDLLKPEDAALLPFLALLGPDRYKQAVTTLKNRIRTLRVRYGANQQPKDRNFIGAPVAETVVVPGVLGTGDATDDELLTLADKAAAGGDASMIASTGSFLDRWRTNLADAYRKEQLELLLTVLRKLYPARENALKIEWESETYLRPATEMARRGYEVIIYGHTHLAKRVTLTGRSTDEGIPIQGPATYFNSGTWADLMTLPRGIATPDSSTDARERLSKFVNDLVDNRLENWRRQLPTFVRVDLDEGGDVIESELEMLDESGKLLNVTTEVWRNHLEVTSA